MEGWVPSGRQSAKPAMLYAFESVLNSTPPLPPYLQQAGLPRIIEGHQTVSRIMANQQIGLRAKVITGGRKLQRATAEVGLLG